MINRHLLSFLLLATGFGAAPGVAKGTFTDHTPTSVTTTRAALGLGDETDGAEIRKAARAWCQTMVRGGGRISRIDLLSGGKVRCWYKN